MGTDVKDIVIGIRKDTPRPSMRVKWGKEFFRKNAGAAGKVAMEDKKTKMSRIVAKGKSKAK